MDLGGTCLLEKKGGRTRVGSVCLVHVGRWPGPHSLAGPASSRAAVVGGEAGRETPVSQGSEGSGESPSAWMEATS